MAAIDLTTTAAVRAFMQVPPGETEQDAITAALITAASRAIMRHAQREFAPAADGKAREFEYNGSGLLDLTPYDLRGQPTLVEIDTDTTAVTVGTEQYRTFPYPNSEGVFTALRLDVIHHGTFNRWPKRRVRITGNWGWESVPEDVEQACALTVAVWLRRDVATFTTTFNIDEARLERPEALPSAVRGMLQPYRRAAV